MIRSRLSRRIADWVRGKFTRPPSPPLQPRRGPVSHVIILDGTMSSLEPGQETNAGLAYKLCLEQGKGVSVYYEPGIQWKDWRTASDVMMGRGINRQIRRAYGFLASRYRPGDRIYLMGYSRGAFAVRSLAGIIDMVGLLRPEHATVRNIRDIYRHYECSPDSEGARVFADRLCQPEVTIEMIGVWDTVKALGLRLPLLWKFSAPRHEFHNHHLGPAIRNGFQALALNETRMVYEPVLWDSVEGWHGRVEQVWFRGTHGDVGGQIGGFEAARPLANIPFVWMMEQAEACGLPLPQGWQEQFPSDANAPSAGLWRGNGKWFWLRRPRVVGSTQSEHVHATAKTALENPGWFNWSGAGRPVA